MRKLTLNVIFSVLIVTLSRFKFGNLFEIPINNPGELDELRLSDTTAEAVDVEVQQTLELLNWANGQLVLDPTYRDLVLVVGNEGIDTETIAKFLTGHDQSLESYWAGDRHLIRDMSPLPQSPSLDFIPRLYIDSETDTAFYNLPSFHNEKNNDFNSGQQIVQTISLKKVIDHAHRLKIIFVVNHNSMRSGENEEGLNNLLEFATNWLKAPEKFQNGIALIVTKVEISLKDSRVIEGIEAFLRNVINSIRSPGQSLRKDDSKIQDNIKIYLDLLNSFLNNENGTKNQDQVNKSSNHVLPLTHIGILRQPQDEGLLTRFPEIQSMKPVLRQIVLENLKFQNFEKENFNFLNFLSNPTISLFSRVENQLIKNVKSGLEKLESHINQSQLFNDSFNTAFRVENLNEQVRFLENLTKSLQDSINFSGDFFYDLKTKIAYFEQKFNGTSEVVEEKCEFVKILKELSQSILDLNTVHSLKIEGKQGQDDQDEFKWKDRFLTHLKEFLRFTMDRLQGKTSEMNLMSLKKEFEDDKTSRWTSRETGMAYSVLGIGGILVEKGVGKAVRRFRGENRRQDERHLEASAKRNPSRQHETSVIPTTPAPQPKNAEPDQKKPRKYKKSLWKVVRQKLRPVKKG